ncbi:MAG TPA: M28 family peptidase [Vicinamibacterales bacterium]
MTRLFAFLFALSFVLGAPLAAQDDGPVARPRRSTNGPWFGLTLPTGPGTEPAVIVGQRAPHPFVPPPGEPASPELAGTAIRADLERIVGFSKESRAAKEVGSGQLWGRISGLASSGKTVDWFAEQFKKAGIADVRVQPMTMEGQAGLWLPLQWEVKVLGDPAFGAGSQDVVLQSAMPVGGTPSGTVTAPLVYVGTGGRAVLEHIDVKGKIAVQLNVPQGHMVFERGPVGSQATELIKRGAVGVLNLLKLPGNELGKDFGSCGGQCFNIGGRDSFFLEQLLDSAAEKGVSDKVRVQTTLRSEVRRGLTAKNAIAIVPGQNPNEIIIVDAHIDAWFDGAGDNGDGASVMLALAKHFAKPENRPARTLVFVASAGHHTTGLNGPRGFIAANPDLVAKTVLVLNIEHVAQRNFSPARTLGKDGYRLFMSDTGEAPMYPGITNKAPFLNDVVTRGAQRYGPNFISQETEVVSGEMGGFTEMKVAKAMVIQAPPLYHTTGETLDIISTPGLERIARYLAFFVKEVAAAPKDKINP